MRLVGVVVFGERAWRLPIAAGLQVSRSTLHRQLAGKRSPDPSSIDTGLINLIASERLQSERRVRALRKLERKMMDHLEHVAAAKASLGRK
ncbi:hypothetical protein [Bradyrhizobium diazoefficiens]|uniref:hypothetical protein n=1 Tax=Bradyrhizobium diazoefficiens TaxID=1355477 RepID=UPI0012FF543B|nr:hypothetical protein [Bradyrhizobium diazoefficiens]